MAQNLLWRIAIWPFSGRSRNGLHPNMKTTITSLLIFGLATASSVHATQVFSEDFESGSAPSEITGSGSVIGTQGYSAHGFGDSFFRNDTIPALSTEIDLAGLASHNSVTLSFDLAVINSWDGSSGGTVAPDQFNVTIDGTVFFAETFDNFSASDQSYAGTAIVSRENLFRDSGDNVTWVDSAYNLTLTVPHTSSSLDIAFFASGSGWQGTYDESFAIDNITVDATGGTGVPDGGGTLALLSVALLGMTRFLGRKNS